MCVEKDELEDRGMAFHSGETTHGEAGEKACKKVHAGELNERRGEGCGWKAAVPCHAD